MLKCSLWLYKHRAGRADEASDRVGEREEPGSGWSWETGPRPMQGGRRSESCSAPTFWQADEESGESGTTSKQHGCSGVCWQKMFSAVSLYILCWLKVTELALLTSKINLLEDAKKKKEEEARKWQKMVRDKHTWKQTAPNKYKIIIIDMILISILLIFLWFSRHCFLSEQAIIVKVDLEKTKIELKSKLLDVHIQASCQMGNDQDENDESS